MALYQFSEIVEDLVPFTSDLRLIDRGISRVQVGAATALYDAIFLGSQSLMRRQGRKVLVVITDGGDTMSQVDYHGALREAQQADALVYSIIMVPIQASAGRNTGGEHALIQMSEDTGGKHYYADTPQEIDRAFRRISDELRTQYVLGYYPRQRLSGSDFRRIQVKVTPPADAGLPLPLPCTPAIAPATTPARRSDGRRGGIALACTMSSCRSNLPWRRCTRSPGILLRTTPSRKPPI